MPNPKSKSKLEAPKRVPNISTKKGLKVKEKIVENTKKTKKAKKYNNFPLFLFAEVAMR